MKNFETIINYFFKNKKQNQLFQLFFFPSKKIGYADKEYNKLSQQLAQLSNNVNSIQKSSNQLGTSKDTQELREKL